MYAWFHRAIPFGARGVLGMLCAPGPALEAIADAREDDVGDEVSTAWPIPE